MAQQFVQTKITGGKVVVFIKPKCPYCVMAQRVFSEYTFKPGHLECVDISGHRDMDKIQDYLMELTGARTVNAAFVGLKGVREDVCSGALAICRPLCCHDVICTKQEVHSAPAGGGPQSPPGIFRLQSLSSHVEAHT